MVGGKSLLKKVIKTRLNRVLMNIPERRILQWWKYGGRVVSDLINFCTAKRLELLFYPVIEHIVNH